MISMSLKERDIKADKMVQEHHELTQEILKSLRGVGETAKPRITLFIEKASEDGEIDTRRI